MSKKRILSNVNDVLEEYQFRSSGPIWNRDSGDFVDVIDLQFSKSSDTFTVNVGVAEKSVLNLMWGMDGSSTVDEPSCTVRARLGHLMTGRDIWWPVADEDSFGEVLSGIEDVAIHFLQLNHSVDRMIEVLQSSSSSRNYPPEAIYLALLYNRKGDRRRSVEMLKTLDSKFTGGWREKVSHLMGALN